MTDMLTREGVTETTTPIVQALTLPYVRHIASQVRRFGFEYEMLPSGYCDEDDDDDLRHWDADDAWSYDHDPCNCDECITRRIDDHNERADELQAERRNSDAAALIDAAYANGLIKRIDMHEYHCDCDICAYDRERPLMCAQEDGTCGVEFVSRIIDLDNFDIARTDISSWVQMMKSWRDDGNWMPDGITANGNHVHVSCNGDDVPFAYDIVAAAKRHIEALYAIFDWDSVADGGCGQVRSYNSKPRRSGGYAGWIRHCDHLGTFEHRLWNTPCDPERLWVHLGLSIALTRWGLAIAEAMPDFSFYGFGSGIDDETYNLTTALIGEVVRGIRSYIPNGAEFDLARRIILNLRPS